MNIVDDLKLDELNLLYFKSLYEQKLRPREENIVISKNAFPTAIAPADLLAHLPYVNYEDLKKTSNELLMVAKKLSLWIKKTHGGGGTSIERKKYLARVKKTNDVHLAAKGTDLFINIDNQDISLAEVQILQTLHDLESQKFAEVFLHNIVSSESKEALEDLWDKKSLLHPDQTYRELTHTMKNFFYFGETFQSVLPTIDEDQKLSTKRKAPGGHAFFAVDALLAALDKEKRPSTKNPLISIIGNGEDLGSTPDDLVLGWVSKNNIAISMITTEKTQNDSKGGQISIVQNEKEIYITLIETAQAKQSGQLELFEKIGLEIKNDNQKSFFNTNIAVFNYEVLIPKLEALVKKVGPEVFLEIITPTLIENKKKQRDQDGVERVYEQLEGAMGSTLLNLDRHWRKIFGEPLVHFINIERENRTRFFSPIKSAFDFFMLFHSDRFKFDDKTFRLHDQKPGALPLVSLESEFYQDVENTLNAFENSKILNLVSLKINGGPVILKNVELSGNISIKNQQTAQVNLSHLKLIKNQKLDV